MQPALDRNTLDRLIALGRQQGQLTTADLRAGLPIESMSAEEIALIVIHLEESGVAVELEEELLSKNHALRPSNPNGAEIIPFPNPAARAEKRARKLSSLKAAAAASPETSASRPYEGRAAHWIVATAGLLALAVLALIIFVSGN